jgi:hypothetical protein
VPQRYDRKGSKVRPRQEPTSPPGELDVPYDTWLFGNKGPKPRDTSNDWLFSEGPKPGPKTFAERKREQNPTWEDRLRRRFPNSPLWRKKS